MRKFTRVLALLPLVLTAALLPTPVRAQTPNTVSGITPFSWPEFKSAYGLPSTPTTLDDSAQTDGTNIGLNDGIAYPLTADEEIRAFLLGDYGNTIPPVGNNNFLDLEAGGLAGLDGLEAWVGPFYGDTTGLNNTLIVDDDLSLDSVTLYENTAATTPVTTEYGYYFDTGWTNFSAAGAPAGTSNFYGDSYKRIQAVSRSEEDSNHATGNYAEWEPDITQPGYYSIYAWFPSENLTASTPEPHVSDARYTIYIKLPNQAMTTTQVTVSQTNGGTWVPLPGTYNLPVTSGNFSNTQNGTNPATLAPPSVNQFNYNAGQALVCIKLDDTTNNSLTQTINSTAYNNFVVADAIELRSDDGLTTRSLGTPVAINITAPILQTYTSTSTVNTTSYSAPISTELGTRGDYDEIALGYGAGFPNGDGMGIGGKPICYVTSTVTGTGTAKKTSPSPPQYFNGSIGYNTGAISSPVAAPTLTPGDTLPATLPIDQVVYFTRTETVNTNSNNSSENQPVGFLYCANGATGDIIWRYPSIVPTSFGDTDTGFLPGGFAPDISTNTSSSFNGETYSIAPGNGNASATGADAATWPAPTSVSGRCYVYVWFPSQSAGEQHVTDARYTVTDSSATPHVCNPINQQGGGQWVQLTNTDGTSVYTFAGGTGQGVQLSNASNSSSWVVADAVEFVPVSSMGTSDSTPAVIRNLKVINPGYNPITGATTYQPEYLTRTVVVVADNLGKIYCVDAAGNGDGNDILKDANNVLVQFDSTGIAYEYNGGAAPTTPAVLPLTPSAVGTTQAYWIWQPNTLEPLPATIGGTAVNQTDPSSQLIAPLAFGTCSPIVHTTKLAVPSPPDIQVNGTHTIQYDPFSAKIYIGNSNGVLYALDATGAPSADADPHDVTTVFQRDNSLDPQTPSPSVDWWFNVGVTSVDSTGALTEAVGPDGNPLYYISQSIAGTPAYYHSPIDGYATPYVQDPNDLILFTTFSPQSTNQGRLYAVKAQGPVGYYGTPTEEPDASGLTAYQQAAGEAGYNLSPLPYYSFPDAYGTPHLPNSSTPLAVSGTDHRPVTSLVPPLSNGLIPAAHALGNAAGSPTIFGVTKSAAYISVPNPAGGANLQMSPHVYFAADDPTTDGSDATEGRIYGVNLVTGTVDAGNSVNGGTVNSYIYPTINPDALNIAFGAFDPNVIPLSDPDIPGTTSDYITAIFNTADTNYNYNTLQFGPFTSGPVTFNGGALPYYVSSSPAVGLIHTIPVPTTNGTTANTLPPTLIGGDGYSALYGGSTGAYDIDVPMLYVGDQDGVLHSLNLAGFNDQSRFIQDATLDGSSIISTPALLANGNGPNSGATPDTDSNVGGVLFVTTASGSLWESEAFPFIEGGQSLSLGDTTPIARNVDFQYGGPGGFSSVAASSYNIDNFEFTSTSSTTANKTGGQSVAGVLASASVDTSEWLYVSSDSGYTYGLTANNTALGNGGPGGYDPGYYIGTESSGLNGENTIPLNRNIVTSVFATEPAPWPNPGTNATTSYSKTNGRPPQNPVFDWGQTVYIMFYGLDSPSAGSTQGSPPTANQPKALQLTFNIGPPGSAAYGPGTQTKTIDLQASNAVAQIATGGDWPPPGYVLTSTLGTTTSEVPSVGNYAAMYAFQLGNATSGDPQTPGSKIQILGIKEQVQYYTTATGSSSPTLITTVISARSTSGTIIREAASSGTGYQDAKEPGIDQATFSILNPLAVRTAARSMGSNPLPNWYNMALASSGNYSSTELGPFCGIPSSTSSEFSLEQGALANGNSVPTSAPLGGTLTNSSGTMTNPNEPANSTSNAIQSVPTIPIIMVIAPGMIGHGTDGNTSTINPKDYDPTSSTAPAVGALTGAAVNPAAPGNAGPGDYGASLLDIADRSGLGDILQPITNLAVSQAALAWNDNSGAGGAQAVVNPLPWEQMPTANQASGSGSVDYQNIAKGDTSFELLPRTSADYNTELPSGRGSDTVITTGNGTLPLASTTSTGGVASNPADRTVYPAPALVRIQVPKFQPANLESYNELQGGKLRISGSTRFSGDAAWRNVANGYIGSFRVYVNTAGARASQRAYRTVQVWASVPADTHTEITEQSIDIGSVPAGFGINLSSSTGTPADSSSWNPTYNALTPYYKPITVVNDGNVNLLNLQLDQYVNYGNNTQTPNLVPNAFGSYQASDLSTIPSFDVPGPGNSGLLTGTADEPLLRSSFDDFQGMSGATSKSPFYIYSPNYWIGDAVAAGAGTSNPPPGPTVHKARPGDVNGTIATIPDVPYSNLKFTNLAVNANPNNTLSTVSGYFANPARPLVSLAVPLGTPVGTYSQTVTAFEGSDGAYSAYLGPTYGGRFYTNGGWENAGNGVNNYAYALGWPVGATASVQAQSSPGTTLIVHVIEDRLTDGTPLPVTTTNGSGNAVLPNVDNVIVTNNSNDLQPWAFSDTGGSGSSVGLIWSSARNASTVIPKTPFSLYGTLLADPFGLPSVPTAPGRSWWSAPTQLTEVPAPTTMPNGQTINSQQSYAPSTFPSLDNSGTNFLWVTSQVAANGQTVYSLNTAKSNNIAALPSNPTVLFTSSQPIFGPRAQWYSNTLPVKYLGFTPATVNGNSNTEPYPLVLFYQRIGGRSTLMYWPSQSNINGTPTVAPAQLPVPAGLSSGATPTVVPRVPVNGVSQVDVVFSGAFGTAGNSDIITARYAVNTVQTAGPTLGAALLTETGTLPTTALSTTVAAATGLNYATVNEALVLNGTSQNWQARDIAWVRNVNEFDLRLIAGAVNIPLIPAPNGLTPAPSAPVYDRASGQWIFTINWANLAQEYAGDAAVTSALTNIAAWWGVGTSNVTAYVNPSTGVVSFSTPLPKSPSIIPNVGQFVALSVDINPQALRATFNSKSNAGPISFIDDKPKTNAAPGMPNVFPSRYWYIYRKQSAQNGNAGAASSVLYYNTRRLTLVLLGPVQLAYTAANGNIPASYSLPSGFSVKDGNGNDVTQQVDVDWARGRVYFPQQYVVGGTTYSTEGQYFVAQYPYNAGGTSPLIGRSPGIVTWKDEPMVNSPTQTDVSGEHILPISTPSNESEPSAFLDPSAGLQDGSGNLELNPASETPASLAKGNAGQPFAHKVWVFWTSTRNAGNNAGSDIYWETIDPRFEISQP